MAVVGNNVVVTASDWLVPLPQVKIGVTCTFPDTEPTVTVAELVVPPPVCTQPEGKVQLYVAPLMLVAV